MANNTNAADTRARIKELEDEYLRAEFRVNPWLHGTLTFLTGSLWAPVWIAKRREARRKAHEAAVTTVTGGYTPRKERAQFGITLG